MPYWGVWKRENGTKIPYNPVTGRKAKANDAATFSTRAKSERALAKGTYEGVCILVDESLGITMLDFDHVVPEEYAGDETHLPPDVRRIIRMAGTYATWSPSRTGIRMFYAATTGGDYENKNHGRKTCVAEQYNAVRFATIMVDAPISNTPDSFNDNRDDLVAVLEALDFKPRAAEQSERLQPPPPSSSNSLTLDDLLAKAFNAKNGDKVRRLYEGDIGDYPESQGDPGFSSEADLALAGYLGFWTHDDDLVAEAMRSSKLSRKKLDRRDYIDRTIQRVRTNQNAWWDPGYGERAPLPMIAPPIAMGATCPEQLQHAQDTIVSLTAQLQDAKQTITTREGVIVRERKLRIAAEARADRLAEAHSKTIQILRTPGLAIGPRVTTFALALDLGARIANGEAPTEHGYRVPAVRLAEMTGQSEGTVAKHLRDVDTRGIVPKHVVRMPARENIDPGSGEITVAGGTDQNFIPVPENNIVNLIDRILDYQRPETEIGHGGIRTPACNEHPNAGTVKRWTIECAECHKPLGDGISYRKADTLEDNPHPDIQNVWGSNVIPDKTVGISIYRGSNLLPHKPAPLSESSGSMMLPHTPAPPPDHTVIPTGTHGHDRHTA
jgi:primase-polymerase (primpol)-like protein